MQLAMRFRTDACEMFDSDCILDSLWSTADVGIVKKQSGKTVLEAIFQAFLQASRDLSSVGMQSSLGLCCSSSLVFQNPDCAVSLQIMLQTRSRQRFFG